MQAQRFSCTSCGAPFRSEYPRCPMDGAKLAATERDPLVGKLLADRYVLEAFVGEGAMGCVYRARHHRVPKEFAVKVLFGEHAADPKMRQRFEREATAASRLNHPNVLSVTDFGETDAHLLYLVMDFIEGRSLADIIEQEAPLPAERIRRLLGQICAGLAHAHDKGIIHRDFKGENVVVTGSAPEEQARIVDFGIAVIQESDEQYQRLTTTGMVIGTPAYMSPEQATAGNLDWRTDLFSLGVVLYEMLSGKHPFGSSVLNVVSMPAPLVRELRPGYQVDGHLETIALKLLEKQPAARFQSAREILTALENTARMDQLGTEEIPQQSGLPSVPPAMTVPPAMVPQAAVPALATGITDPAEPHRRRLRMLLIAPPVAVLVIIAVLALLGGGRDQGKRSQAAAPDSAAMAVQSAPHAQAARVAQAAIDAAPVAIDAAPADAAAVELASNDQTGAEPSSRQASDTRSEPGSSKRKSSSSSAQKTPADTVDESDLVSLYTKIGEELEKLRKERGEEAVASLWATYKSIRLDNAMRNSALQREAYEQLRALQRQVRRLRKSG